MCLLIYTYTSAHKTCHLVFNTEASILDLHLFISYNIFSTNIYDRRNNLDFEIVNFPFLDGDVSCSTSYGVYISQLIRFSRAFSHFADFNTCNKLLTQKLLKRGYRYHKLHITYSEFYSRYYDLIPNLIPCQTCGATGLSAVCDSGIS